MGYVDPASAIETGGEVMVSGKVDLETERGRERWRLAKSGTLGFSFGYLTTDEYKRPDGTREIRGLDLFEISIVAAPANQDTRVLSTKALDEYGHVREEAKRWMFDLLTMPAESKSLSPEPEAESGRNLPITIKSYES